MDTTTIREWMRQTTYISIDTTYTTNRYEINNPRLSMKHPTKRSANSSSLTYRRTPPEVQNLPSAHCLHMKAFLSGHNNGACWMCSEVQRVYPPEVPNPDICGLKHTGVQYCLSTGSWLTWFCSTWHQHKIFRISDFLSSTIIKNTLWNYFSILQAKQDLFYPVLLRYTNHSYSYFSTNILKNFITYFTLLQPLSLFKACATLTFAIMCNSYCMYEADIL